jgi:hypothetical protein
VTLDDFKASLKDGSPPKNVAPELQALWHDARGDWDGAHRIAQDIENRKGAWVHAYLHRKEGDLTNASYWYRHAGRPVATGSLDEEWSALVTALISTLETPQS